LDKSLAPSYFKRFYPTELLKSWGYFVVNTAEYKAFIHPLLNEPFLGVIDKGNDTQ